MPCAWKDLSFLQSVLISLLYFRRLDHIWTFCFDQLRLISIKQLHLNVIYSFTTMTIAYKSTFYNQYFSFKFDLIFMSMLWYIFVYITHNYYYFSCTSLSYQSTEEVIMYTRWKVSTHVSASTVDLIVLSFLLFKLTDRIPSTECDISRICDQD